MITLNILSLNLSVFKHSNFLDENDSFASFADLLEWNRLINPNQFYWITWSYYFNLIDSNDSTDKEVILLKSLLTVGVLNTVLILDAPDLVDSADLVKSIDAIQSNQLN